MTLPEFQAFCISLVMLGCLFSPFQWASALSSRIENYLVDTRNILRFPSWLVVILFGK